jgi:hypothetical protein
MERLIDQFHAIVREFRLKRHDLLDYHNNKFDRDYVEFNVKVKLQISFWHFFFSFFISYIFLSTFDFILPIQFFGSFFFFMFSLLSLFFH